MKVLILSAKTGGGHMRAAQALEEVIKERDENNEVMIVDGLEYVNHYFNKAVVKGYKFSATKLPRMYGVLYRASNNDSNTYKLVQRTNSHFAKKFIPLLAEFKPDVMVSTHPFMSIMCSRLREKCITNIPLVSILTDFAPHASYINPCVSEYVVSSEQMVDELEKLGVDRSIVHPVGIPIPPVFFEKDEQKEEHLRKMGFDPSLQTVLIMAGSFGVTDILKIYENLNDIEDVNFQTIVITGRNQKLFNAFNTILNNNPEMRVGDIQVNFEGHEDISRRDLKIKLTKKTKLIYFTDEVQTFMHISDLIITKPGGLTVTESLASCLPMVLFRGIPGQETDNTEYLTANNLAVSIQKTSTEDKLHNMLHEKKRSNAADTISKLLKYPERLRSMKESCSRLNNRDSAYKVYDIMKKSVDEMNAPVILPSENDAELLADELEAERLIREFEEVVNKYSGDDFEYALPDDSDGEYEFEDKGYRFIDMMYQNFKKRRSEHQIKKELKSGGED